MSDDQETDERDRDRDRRAYPLPKGAVRELLSLAAAQWPPTLQQRKVPIYVEREGRARRPSAGPSPTMSGAR
jgi:hypothetical protein